MTEWPWYVQVAAGGVIVVVGIWLLLHVAVRILIMKTERDLLRIKLAAFGLEMNDWPQKARKRGL